VISSWVKGDIDRKRQSLKRRLAFTNKGYLWISARDDRDRDNQGYQRSRHDRYQPIPSDDDIITRELLQSIRSFAKSVDYRSNPKKKTRIEISNFQMVTPMALGPTPIAKASGMVTDDK